MRRDEALCYRQLVQHGTPGFATQHAHLGRERVCDVPHGQHELDGGAALAAEREAALEHRLGRQVQVRVAAVVWGWSGAAIFGGWSVKALTASLPCATVAVQTGQLFIHTYNTQNQ